MIHISSRKKDLRSIPERRYDPNYFAKPGDKYYALADVRMKFLADSISKFLHPKSALDLGCAHGFLVRRFREEGIDAYGIDISSSAFSMAPDGVRQYLMLANGEVGLPFADNSFDMVTAIEVLEHYSDLDNGLQEIRRVLNDGGYLFMTSPLPLIDSRWGQLLLGKGWRRLDATHVSVNSRLHWKHMMEHFGFRYHGMLSNAFHDSPSEFPLLSTLCRLPGGEGIRAYLCGAALYQKQPLGIYPKFSHSFTSSRQ